MKKSSIFCLALLLLFSPLLTAQQPAPYSMLDPNPYVPGKDPDIDMYIGDWKESMVKTTHGSLVERDILTKGDPMKPSRRGAVLKYLNGFTYAELGAHASTVPVTLKGEQEIYFVISGSGTIRTGTETTDLYKGIAVLVPENLEFTIQNNTDESLLLYLVTERCPEGFRPNKSLLVRDENVLPSTSSDAHWVGIVKVLFETDDGLATLESVLTVMFSPMTFFHPHSHLEGCEEVWTSIYDDIHVLLGKQIRLQKAGTAYMIPPDGNTPHANFNVSDKLIKMFYFARYREHEVRK